MAAFVEDGEWRIPCVQYKVDDDGKPIAGSARSTTMKASEAAASLIAHVQDSVYGVCREIEKNEASNSQGVELDYTASFMQIHKFPIV